VLAELDLRPQLMLHQHQEVAVAVVVHKKKFQDQVELEVVVTEVTQVIHQDQSMLRPEQPTLVAVAVVVKIMVLAQQVVLV
tara:strand:+ start:257 stop:499 length:243 start_codon:yes stop_codon:yes gene_type:complete